MRDLITRQLTGLSKTLALALVLFTTLIIFTNWRFGSLHSALVVWQGLPISVDSATRSLGKVESGMKLYRVFTFRNHSDTPIRIIGSMSTCTCIVIDELPITIPARGTNQLQVLVNVPDLSRIQGGVFSQSVDLLTSVPTQPELPLRITGEVTVHPATKG
jgi:hypothetical protein